MLNFKAVLFILFLALVQFVQCRDDIALNHKSFISLTKKLKTERLDLEKRVISVRKGKSGKFSADLLSDVSHLTTVGIPSIISKLDSAIKKSIPIIEGDNIKLQLKTLLKETISIEKALDVGVFINAFKSKASVDIDLAKRIQSITGSLSSTNLATNKILTAMQHFSEQKVKASFMRRLMNKKDDSEIKLSSTDFVKKVESMRKHAGDFESQLSTISKKVESLEKNDEEKDLISTSIDRINANIAKSKSTLTDLLKPGNVKKTVTMKEYNDFKKTSKDLIEEFKTGYSGLLSRHKYVTEQSSGVQVLASYLAELAKVHIDLKALHNLLLSPATETPNNSPAAETSDTGNSFAADSSEN